MTKKIQWSLTTGNMFVDFIRAIYTHPEVRQITEDRSLNVSQLLKEAQRSRATGVAKSAEGYEVVICMAIPRDELVLPPRTQWPTTAYWIDGEKLCGRTLTAEGEERVVDMDSSPHAILHSKGQLVLMYEMLERSAQLRRK